MEQTPELAQVFSGLCSQECIDKLTEIRKHNDELIHQCDLYHDKWWKLDQKEKVYKEKIEAQKLEIRSLKNELSNSTCVVKDLDKTVTDLKQQLSELQSKYDLLEANYQNTNDRFKAYEFSSEKAINILEAQIRRKMGKGLGYPDVPPPNAGHYAGMPLTQEEIENEKHFVYGKANQTGVSEASTSETLAVPNVTNSFVTCAAELKEEVPAPEAPAPTKINSPVLKQKFVTAGGAKQETTDGDRSEKGNDVPKSTLNSDAEPFIPPTPPVVIQQDKVEGSEKIEVDMKVEAEHKETAQPSSTTCCRCRATSSASPKSEETPAALHQDKHQKPGVYTAKRQRPSFYPEKQHWPSFYPKKQTCYNCGIAGHIARNCVHRPYVPYYGQNQRVKPRENYYSKPMKVNSPKAMKKVRPMVKPSDGDWNVAKNSKKAFERKQNLKQHKNFVKKEKVLNKKKVEKPKVTTPIVTKTTVKPKTEWKQKSKAIPSQGQDNSPNMCLQKVSFLDASGIPRSVMAWVPIFN